MDPLTKRDKEYARVEILGLTERLLASFDPGPSPVPELLKTYLEAVQNYLMADTEGK